MGGAVHTYSFQPPRWRSPGQLHVETLAALVGTLVWALLYGWLTSRLWSAPATLLTWLSLSLIFLLIALGVGVAVLWWFVARRWLAHLRPNRWRALTLEQMRELTPSQFEQYVAERIFARQGYRAINTPDVKDGGVDIILFDAEGQQMIVQCKRYRSTVGEETVRDLYGALIHSGAEYAFLVTTSNISQPARAWAADKPIELIDGAQLVALARSLPGQTP